MSRARGALCRACLALAAALAALLLLPLPAPRARTPPPALGPPPRPCVAPAQPAAPRLRPDDVFIAVKTTRKNHRPRLALLLRTWISRARRQTFIFTDGDDPELQLQGGSHVINTNCSAVHTRQALCCKMSVEYDKFIESGRKWFCHVDDDNYVNPGVLLQLLSNFSPSQDVYLGRPSLDHPIEATERVQGGRTVTTVKFWFATGGAGFCLSRGLALKMSPWASLGGFMSTAERVRLPDDCTVGYIVEGLLGARLLSSPLFHSHLENLQRLPSEAVLQQVTLSYGGPENPQNVVNVAGGFSLQQDPTRFKSVHCLLYPETDWCPLRKHGALNSRATESDLEGDTHPSTSLGSAEQCRTVQSKGSHPQTPPNPTLTARLCSESIKLGHPAHRLPEAANFLLSLTQGPPSLKSTHSRSLCSPAPISWPQVPPEDGG